MKLGRFSKLLVLLLISTLIISSCSKEPEDTPQLETDQLVNTTDSKIIVDWYEKYLEIERYLEDFRPNPTARALAYIGLAAYEATLPGNPGLTSMDNQLNGYTHPRPTYTATLYWKDEIENSYYWEAVLNHVYYLTFQQFLYNMDQHQLLEIEQLYFANARRISDLMTNIGYRDAINRAEVISEAVIEYAKTDTESEVQILDIEPADYQPPTGKGFWQPTGPDFSNACHPYWYKVRRFVTPESGIEYIDPAPYSEDPASQFYKEAKEVNDVVGNLTTEDRWIAEFWSDDITGLTFSPPARQIAIANQLVNLDQIGTSNVLQMYLRLGLALNDAAIVCWQGKYEYNLERPIDYIRRVINPDFTTILGEAEGIPSQNPNFPAYPSGHSTFASAGAAVFEQYFSLAEFTDRCHEDRTEFNGNPRTFYDFHEMARENAYSRIPLGVHFRMDCDEGLRLGYEVGKYATSFRLES